MTEYYRGKYRVPSARAAWHGYDGGTYFVTICVADRVHAFGEVVAGEMCPTPLGIVANDYWEAIPQHHPGVTLYEFVLMPDHVHGVLELAPERQADGGGSPVDLRAVIRGYKAAVTSQARRMGIPFAWQTRFHDHVVRHQDERLRIEQYIRNNPVRWQEGREAEAWWLRLMGRRPPRSM